MCQHVGTPWRAQALTSRGVGSGCGRRTTTVGDLAHARVMSIRRPAPALPDPWPSRPLRELGRRQHGVAKRAQIIEAGLTRRQVDAHLEAGRWRQLNDHVFALHNGELTRGGQMWAVLLSAQLPAALCSLTVLELFAVKGFATDAVHVLVPRGARVLPVPGVMIDVHESRQFVAEDVIRFSGFAVTSLSRSSVDAAVWSRDVLTAHRIFVAVVQQLGVRPGKLLEDLEAAGKVRHRQTLRRLLVDLEGGAQALSEVAFLAFCRRHGFPRPQLQVRLDAAGRRRHLDATVRRKDGSVFHVEVDGGVHLTLAARWNDTRKDNDSALAGSLVLRFPSVAIYRDDPDAVRQIQCALTALAA